MRESTSSSVNTSRRPSSVEALSYLDSIPEPPKSKVRLPLLVKPIDYSGSSKSQSQYSSSSKLVLDANPLSPTRHSSSISTSSSGIHQHSIDIPDISSYRQIPVAEKASKRDRRQASFLYAHYDTFPPIKVDTGDGGVAPPSSLSSEYSPRHSHTPYSSSRPASSLYSETLRSKLKVTVRLVN